MHCFNLSPLGRRAEHKTGRRFFQRSEGSGLIYFMALILTFAAAISCSSNFRQKKEAPAGQIDTKKIQGLWQLTQRDLVSEEGAVTAFLADTQGLMNSLPFLLYPMSLKDYLAMYNRPFAGDANSQGVAATIEDERFRRMAASLVRPRMIWVLSVEGQRVKLMMADSNFESLGTGQETTVFGSGASSRFLRPVPMAEPVNSQDDLGLCAEVVSSIEGDLIRHQFKRDGLGQVENAKKGSKKEGSEFCQDITAKELSEKLAELNKAQTDNGEGPLTDGMPANKIVSLGRDELVVERKFGHSRVTDYFVRVQTRDLTSKLEIIERRRLQQGALYGVQSVESPELGQSFSFRFDQTLTGDHCEAPMAGKAFSPEEICVQLKSELNEKRCAREVAKAAYDLHCLKNTSLFSPLSFRGPVLE